MATSTTVNDVPDYLEKFYQDNMNNLAANYSTAQNIYNANGAYTPYTNPRIQGFTPDQLQGMQMTRDQVGVGTDALAGAAARAGQAAQSYSDKMPITADVVRSYYQTYLGRDPEPGAIENWMSGAKTVGDLTKGIGGSQEAQLRAQAGYTPDFSKLQDGSFRPNSVQTENFNQALGNNNLSAAQAQANLIGNRAPMIGPVNQITGGNYNADQVGSQQIGALGQAQGGTYAAERVAGRDIGPLGQVQGGTYRPDSVMADQIARMQQLQSRDFSSSDAARYMNPYTQQVTENTTREMMRANDLGRQADAQRAAKAGAFGGSRGAIVQAERDRNFGFQLGDTVAKLNQDAYGNAQSQFNTDISRDLATGQFNVQTDLARQQQNQGAALSAAQGNQQAGARASEFGLGQALTAQQLNQASDLARQQANQSTDLQGQIANQGATSRASEFGLGQALDASKFNIGTDLDRQARNQASALQASGMNQAANSRASEFGLGQNLAAQTSNAANQLQVGQLNQDVGLRSLLADQGASNQIGLANQAATNNMSLANEEARQKVFTTNADTFFKNQANSLASQTQNQNAGLQAWNANRDQFNTDQQRQLASGQLALGMAPVAQGMAMQDANNVLSIGAQQQQLGQQNLAQGYQDFLTQKAQPYENFNFLQSALQGTNYNPYQSLMSQTTNASDPSKLGQAAGLAATAIGVIGGTGGFGSGGWLKSAWGG
jgi:hypothetical protein